MHDLDTIISLLEIASRGDPISKPAVDAAMKELSRNSDVAVVSAYHELMHFIEDHDIRAKDRAYADLQIGRLKQHLRRLVDKRAETNKG